MCLSRLHQVTAVDSDGQRVAAVDLDGRAVVLALLAYDGPAPVAGDWVVAHSGYALGPAEPADARSARHALRAAAGPGPGAGVADDGAPTGAGVTGDAAPTGAGRRERNP